MERYSIKVRTIKVEVGEDVNLGRVYKATDIVDIARTIWSQYDADQEHFGMFALSMNREVIGFKMISSGGIDRATADPRIVWRNALLMGAAGVIFVHNHTSTSTEPSRLDRDLTRILQMGAEVLYIRILDHVILGTNGTYTSMQDQGLL
jgi:DNA repair protein RadC